MSEEISIVEGKHEDGTTILDVSNISKNIKEIDVMVGKKKYKYKLEDEDYIEIHVGGNIRRITFEDK